MHGGVIGGSGPRKKSHLPKGAHRSKSGGVARGRGRHDPIEKAPPRLKNAAADSALKDSRKREEMHPSLQRLTKALRSKLYQSSYGKDRKTPGEVM